jgi:hypothetical protein
MWALVSLQFETQITPIQLQRATISMIHKSGPRDQSKNYRPITLTNTILKLYERIIDSRLKEVIKIDMLQGVGHLGLGSLDTVTAVLDSLNAKPEWVLALYDLSKAFDRVRRDMLFVKLRRMEVKGKLWQAVRATYSHPSVAVRIGNAYSAEESYSSSIN